jgi:hypothetical protein
MNSCAYCGEANEDTTSHCRACGTDLRAALPDETVSRGMNPQTAVVFARFGSPALLFVCIVMAVDVVGNSFNSIGFFLCLGSPLILGLGLWIAHAWSRADLASAERAITGIVLFPALVFLALVSLCTITLILIVGLGPR